jgi:hypothetical protein
MTDIESLSHGKCPDCGSQGFMLGPQGGVSQNIECLGCGQCFNIAPFLDGLINRHSLNASDGTSVEGGQRKAGWYND